MNRQAIRWYIVALVSFTVLVFCCYCLIAYRGFGPYKSDAYQMGAPAGTLRILQWNPRLLTVALGQSGESEAEGSAYPEDRNGGGEEPITRTQVYLSALLWLHILFAAVGVVWLILYPLRMLSR